jgi:hypothetical protein
MKYFKSNIYFLNFSYLFSALYFCSNITLAMITFNINLFYSAWPTVTYVHHLAFTKHVRKNISSEDKYSKIKNNYQTKITQESLIFRMIHFSRVSSLALINNHENPGLKRPHRNL